jgi:hypothetical protein
MAKKQFIRYGMYDAEKGDFVVSGHTVMKFAEAGEGETDDAIAERLARAGAEELVRQMKISVDKVEDGVWRVSWNEIDINGVHHRRCADYSVDE